MEVDLHFGGGISVTFLRKDKKKLYKFLFLPFPKIELLEEMRKCKKCNLPQKSCATE